MPIPEEVKNQAFRIAKIAKMINEGFMFCGSGFFINHNNKKYVVTNEHVINKNNIDSNFWAVDINKDTYPLRLLQTELKHDFALLETEIYVINSKNDLELLNGNFDVGMSLYTAGYDDRNPNSAAPNFQEGTLYSRQLLIITEESVSAAPDGYKGEVAMGFVVKGFDSILGASGSPVFTSDGKIIGYVKGTINHQSEKMAICIAINKLFESLQ